MSDSFITLDANLTIVAWTSGAKDLFGYEAGEILGQPVFILVPDDERQAAAAILAKVQAEGSVQGFHAERLVKGGGRIKIVADLLAVRNSTGDHCATQISVRRAS